MIRGDKMTVSLLRNKYLFIIYENLLTNRGRRAMLLIVPHQRRWGIGDWMR